MEQSTRQRLGFKKWNDMCWPEEDTNGHLRSIAAGLAMGRYKNIITMCGAGISVSAGIPDFRSPDTGVYSKVKQLYPNLASDPETIFSLSAFKKNPAVFNSFIREIIPPSDCKPTRAHRFIKKLHDRGLLVRAYTQNIDMLEEAARIPEDKIVHAHGSMNKAHCIACQEEYNFEEWKKLIESNTLPNCRKCGSNLIKPDITFFGEQLPADFFKNISADFAKCDLLIVMGTSLRVHPFADLIDKVKWGVPVLYINKTPLDKQFSDSIGNFFFYQGSANGGARTLESALYKLHT